MPKRVQFKAQVETKSNPAPKPITHRSSRAAKSNPFAHPASTVFLLTALCTLVGKESDKKKDLPVSFVRTYVCPTKSEPYTYPTPTSPITLEVIAQFVDGTPLDCGFVAQFVNETRNLNSYLQNYLDFSFSHLKNFKYQAHLSSESYFQETGIDSEATFQRKTEIDDQNNVIQQLRTINIKEVTKGNKFLIMENIRHEARHAAMLTAQEILSFSPRPQTECYFPQTASENSKLLAMLDTGLKNLENLKQLIIEEQEEKISSSNRDILNGLRKQCKEEYLKYYQIETSLSISRSALKELEREQKQIARPGEILKFNFGELLINEVIEHPSDPEKLIVKGNFIDPLVAAVYCIPETFADVKKTYTGQQYLREIDAWLNGAYPQAILQFVFPEFHAYTNEMINRARWLYAAKQDTQKEFELYQILTNRNGMFYNAQNAPNIISFAKYAISQGRYDDARKGLEMLINKGQYKAEAHLELARMENTLKDYKKSAQHYKIAIKEGAELTSDDYLTYSKLLSQVQPKAAEKYYKKSEELNAKINSKRPRV